MFDITAQSVADNAFIHFKGLDGAFLYVDGKPVGVDLWSPGSDIFAEVAERQSARTISRMNEDDDQKIPIVAKAQLDKEAAEDLASLTRGFVNLTYPPAGGAQGHELFKAFYADRKLGHFKQQVLKALRDWGKFAPASSEA